jgi:penicillin-binding protein 1A
MSRSQRYRRLRRSRGRHRSQALLAVVVVLILVGLAGLSVVAWVASTAASAPSISSLKERDPGANTEVLAADGTRLGFISADDLSRPIKGSQMPKALKDATVAIEDERFYKHKGVDYEGIVRAAVKNFISKKTVEGGSTLTMQLVKNLYTADRARNGLAGYKRKIREAKLAEELEDEHSKEWILEKYLNTTSYGTVGGQTAIGVEAAARVYFNKRAKNLNLREAALLAGLPQAPTDYSPILHGAAANARRGQVLDKMAELGMIAQGTANRAKAKGMGLNPSDYFSRRREGYFFDYVKDELIKEYGTKTVKLGGLVVHTTIDLDMQRKAREAIAAKMGAAGPSSALVTINPRNGDILAMASSGDYAQNKFNLAAQGQRQPGSSFKVFALMTALRNGVNPNSTRYTSVSPTVLNDPRYGHIDVKTYGGTSGGNMNLFQATLRSDNSVYIQLALDLGPDKVAQTAVDMGIKRRHVHGYPAESLGGLEEGVSPLEMATAYATIASGGYRNRPTAITKVEFPGSHKNELPRRWRPHRTKVFPDGVTYEATKILEANIQGGTGTHANIGCPAGGKTGTTDNNTDAWFVGFTPRLATAVWVGYPNERVYMSNLYFGGPVDGGTFPADIWGAYMKSVIGKFCGPFRQPKEPFQSRPFFGRYSSNGGNRLGLDAGKDEQTTPDQAQPQPQPQTTPDTQQPDDTGGTQFDPDAYESPPQGPPDTEPVTPPGDTQG